MAQTRGEAAKRVKALTHEAVDPDAIPRRLVLGPLQSAEETGRARDGNRHEAQLSKVAGPLLRVHTLEGG
jgi:hypothetical protein